MAPLPLTPDMESLQPPSRCIFQRLLYIMRCRKAHVQIWLLIAEAFLRLPSCEEAATNPTDGCYRIELKFTTLGRGGSVEVTGIFADPARRGEQGKLQYSMMLTPTQKPGGRNGALRKHS